MKMRFLLLLILGLYLVLAEGRPSQLEGENDKATSEVKYEAGDSVLEYMQEDRDSLEIDPQRNYDDREDSQMEEENEDAYSETDAENSDNKNNQQFLDNQKANGNRLLKINGNVDDINEQSSSNKMKVDVYKRTSHEEKPGMTSSITSRNKLQENIYNPSDANENAGGLLFRNVCNQSKKDVHNNHNDNADTNQRSMFTVRKELYNPTQRQSDNDYLYERARREAQNSEEIYSNKKSTNDKELSDTDDNVDKKDTKELTRQDLEDLLGLLSKEKIAMIKKIINEKESIMKRDITKKAGAVDDNSFADNSRLSVTEIQGEAYSSDHTEPSISPDVALTESTKQTESSDSNGSKNCDSTKTDSNADLSDVNQDQSQIEEIKNSHSVIESKNENKREASMMDVASDDISKIQSLEDYKGTVANEDSHCVEDNDWSQSEYSELQKFEGKTLKRETSKEEVPEAFGSIQSLEESFPNSKFDRYTNVDSEMTPLVRVKRTDTNHNDMKNRIEHASLRVPFNSESDDLMAGEKSEIEEHQYFGGEKQMLDSIKLQKEDENINDCNRKKRQLYINQKNQAQKAGNSKIESDKSSIGTDTDNVLSSVEGVDENLMYIGKNRNKRMEKKIENDDLYNTCDKNVGIQIDKDDTLESANNYYGSQFLKADTLDTISENKDLSRFKRVREVNGVMQDTQTAK